MRDVRSLVAGPAPRVLLVLCIGFIGLNVLDAWLTGVALGLGGRELNPLLAPTLGSNIPFKAVLAVAVVLALLKFRLGGLLKPLSVGMVLVCVWNGFAIWSWV